MNRLDDAWNWYRRTREVLGLVRSLAKDWDDGRLPETLHIFKRDEVKQWTGSEIESWANEALEELEDLALVHLFAAFEASIRNRLVVGVEPERDRAEHQFARQAIEKALKEIRIGSFGPILDRLATRHPDLKEQIQQIRRYRNWVAHGKADLEGGGHLPRTDPASAYQRLKKFLQLIEDPSVPPREPE